MPNTGLDLTNPGAAQSVPIGPLCLLSGLAAQAHVVRAFSLGRASSLRLRSGRRTHSTLLPATFATEHSI